jgi:hypothetical protein
VCDDFGGPPYQYVSAVSLFSIFKQCAMIFLSFLLWFITSLSCKLMDRESILKTRGGEGGWVTMMIPSPEPWVTHLPFYLAILHPRHQQVFAIVFEILTYPAWASDSQVRSMIHRPWIICYSGIRADIESNHWEPFITTWQSNFMSTGYNKNVGPEFLCLFIFSLFYFYYVVQSIDWQEIGK